MFSCAAVPHKTPAILSSESFRFLPRHAPFHIFCGKRPRSRLALGSTSQMKLFPAAKRGPRLHSWQPARALQIFVDLRLETLGVSTMTTPWSLECTSREPFGTKGVRLRRISTPWKAILSGTHVDGSFKGNLVVTHPLPTPSKHAVNRIYHNRIQETSSEKISSDLLNLWLTSRRNSTWP